MRKIKANFLLYWVEGLWIALFSYNALWTSFVASVIHTNFMDMPPFERFLIVGSVFSNWSITMMALMVTLANKIQKGKPLIGGLDEGNTTIITKKDINEKDNTPTGN